MIPVEQTIFYAGKHQRGNCQAACVASIFEIPLSQAADASTDKLGIGGWIAENYPALDVANELVGGKAGELEYLEDVHTWPKVGEVLHRGFWIAGVKSPRVPAKEIFGCWCKEDGSGDPECEWCHGKPKKRYHGVEWGLHAVVMNGSSLAWDPHPRRDDGVGPIHNATTWRVIDPAKL